MRKSEERQRALLTATSSVIYRMSPDWSEMWQLTGNNFLLDTGESIKDWMQKYIPKEDQKHVLKFIQEAIKNKSVFELEHPVIQADGSVGWTFSRAVPILDDHGNIEEWFGMASDVTTRKQTEKILKEREEHYRFISNTTPVMLWITDKNSRCTFINQTWVDFTGQPYEEAIKFGWLQMVHIDDREMAEKTFMEATRKLEPFSIDYRLRKKDGQYCWANYSGAPLIGAHGEFLGYTGYAIEISERKNAEEALAKSNRELTKINNDLDNFIYTASHDLKAPVSNIEGLINSLKDNLKGGYKESEEDVEQILQMVDSSISRFKNTIQDLTDISKVQKVAAEDVKEINCEQVIEDVKLMILDKIVESKAEIKSDTSRCNTLQFSKKNFNSIVYNLLSNALKYRDPNRSLKIEIITEKIDNYFVLTVKDNGLGISKSNKSKLFGMFKRFHDHIEGSGIGLYIVKRIVDNAGGKIEVESEVGKGTTFKVSFKC